MTKEKYGWTSLGVPITWFAELDNIPAPNALTEAFGDSYLYSHNPVYASVRDSAMGFGYRFSAEDSPMWRDYQSLSLIALHRILSSKIIPYFDTATSFKRLIAASPQARLPPGFIAAGLKKNRAFHESAHCVAHSVMQRVSSDVGAVAAHERDRAVLEAILAESFANTVEALGSAFHFMPLSDRVFYSLNSYFSPDRERTDLLKKAGAELGAELRFALLFFSYFEANLAVQPPGDSIYRRLAETGDCSASQAGLLREITDSAFKLKSSFRENTTPAYFELIGLKSEYLALVNTQWLSHFQNRRFLRCLARAFWEAVGHA
jgi:hypothetical protein